MFLSGVWIFLKIRGKNGGEEAWVKKPLNLNILKIIRLLLQYVKDVGLMGT